MPAASSKQWRLMQAVAHNPKLAKRKGITAATARKVIEGTPKSKRKVKRG